MQKQNPEMSKEFAEILNSVEPHKIRMDPKPEKKRVITVQSKRHKNNMIGQTNPTNHQKPVNRKKKKIIVKVNKVEIFLINYLQRTG